MDAIATGVIRRAGQGVFIVDGNAAIGIRGVTVEEQLTVFGSDGLIVVEQVFDLGLAQGQTVARHLDGDGGGVIQAVQRAQSEAGYNSGVIRIGRRATSQAAFEHHMIIDVAPRRIIRVGRVIDCRVAGVVRIVRIGYVFQLHRIIHRRNGNAQPSLVFTTLSITYGGVDLGYAAVSVMYAGGA